jgi:hypothetical protein
MATLGLAYKIIRHTHPEDIRENRRMKIIKKSLPIRRKTGVVGNCCTAARGILIGRAG